VSQTVTETLRYRR